MSNNRCVIGIDPGFKGYIVALEADNTFTSYPMPVTKDANDHTVLDGQRIKQILLQYADCVDMVTIEKAQAMPGQGAVSGATFVGWQKFISGLCLGLGLPWQEVRPNIWKKALGLRGGKEGKKESVAAAKKMTDCTMSHDAAEALLIAVWARGK